MRAQDFRCRVLFGAGAFGAQAFCRRPENHVVHGVNPCAPMMSISARWHFEIMAFRVQIQMLVRALISIIHRVTGILLALIIPFAGKGS
jgi:hypothetical protein